MIYLISKGTIQSRIIQIEPPQDKINKLACAPIEDSDQPWHPPSMISVFAVRTKKAWVLSYPLSPQQRLIKLGGCLGWSESSLGTQPFCWFCHEVAQMHMRNHSVWSELWPWSEASSSSLYEPPHDKTNKMMHAQQRLRSAQSDQSLRCVLNG